MVHKREMEGFGGNLSGETDWAFENGGAIGEDEEDANEEEEDKAGKKASQGAKEDTQKDSAKMCMGFGSNGGSH